MLLVDSQQDISEIFKDGPVQIQKIMSTASAWCFYARGKGVTHYLYLGRGGLNTYFIHSSLPPESQWRIVDKWLELFRSEFKNSRLTAITIDQEKGYLNFSFLKSKEKKELLYSIYSRDSYFVIKSSEYLIRSWRMRKETRKVDASRDVLVDEFNKIRVLKKNRNPSLPLGDLVSGQYLFKENKRAMKKREKSLSRTLSKIQGEINKCQKWRELLPYAEGLKTWKDVAPPSVKIHDIAIRIPGKITEGKFRDLIYQKIKKLKKGEMIQAQRHAEIQSKMEGAKESNSIPERVLGRVECPVSSSETISSKKLNSSIRLIEFSLGPIRGAVGLDKKSNDALRSKWAAKENLWFHLGGRSSCHVVLKVENISKLSTENIAVIGSILVGYSKLDINEITIVYSMVKDVKGVKGEPGKVLIKRPKYITTNFIKNWKEKLSFSS